MKKILHFTLMLSFLCLTQNSSAQKIPYPIIFIHGWTDDSDASWNQFTNYLDATYNWSFGGRIHFCLNPNSLYKTLHNTITDFNTVNDLSIGEYYYVNFDVDPNGTTYLNSANNNSVQSNQAAVTLQGLAVSRAVKKVLDVTGRDKVILVGHSMGGLAAREYLQNPNFLQSDGFHHVAKLVTVATPNGGSNSSSGDLLKLIFGSGKDELSEAVRDLRYSYSTGTQGLYLFGGVEDPSTVRGVIDPFYNVDVNCNLKILDRITGLNQRPMPNDLSLACVIGKRNSSLQNDFVVDADRADLNLYPGGGLYAERFTLTDCCYFLPKTLHTMIHKDYEAFCFRALDEPKTYDKAYFIRTNKQYQGTITLQAENDPFPAPDNTIDYDDFKFTIPQNGTISFSITNIPVSDFKCYFVNSQGSSVRNFSSGGSSSMTGTLTLNAGNYFFEVSGMPTTSSGTQPYSFRLDFTPTSGASPNGSFNATPLSGCTPLTVNFNDQSTGSPTSWQWTFQGGNPSTSTLQNPTISYNTEGTYNVSLIAKNQFGQATKTENSYIKVQNKPKSDFSFTTNRSNVQFTNLSSSLSSGVTYLWDFGDSTSSNQFAPSHIYARTGLYKVRLTVQSGCGTNVTEKNITILTVNSQEVPLLAEFMIYPNPSIGELIIHLKGKPTEIVTINVFNTIGQNVWQEKEDFRTGKTNKVLDLSKLYNGFYIMQVTDGISNVQKSLVIQK